jgi:signal transduction histidine kinase
MRLASVIAFLRTPGIVRNMLALLTLGFVLLLIIGAGSVWSVVRTRDYSDLVDHTRAVLTATEEVLSLTLEAESGQRGYLITHDSSYLDRYAPASKVLPDRLDALAGMVADNPPQEARARALKQAVLSRLKTLKASVALSRAGEDSAALALVRSGQGRDEMTAIRDLVANMEAEEDTLLGERSARADRSNAITIAVNLTSLLLVGMVAFASIVVIRRYVLELEASRTALDRLNRGLEDTVTERTEELVRANEEIQRFAYIVSHDLRAPLVNVMGYTSELQAAGKIFSRQIERIEAEAPALLDADAALAVREDVPEAIDFIRASTAKMDRLINAILKLSRDGRRVLTAERIDMTTVAQAIADSLHHQVSAAGGQIVVEALPVLVSDRLSIDQIFGNLLDNAAKFLDPARPGLIRISGEAEGPLVVYRIEDNGRGIADKDRERVFELFRRAGAQDRPGEGLGLAFVRNSTRRLGGMIDLKSEPGRGSTFTLKFPKALLELPGNSE